MLVILFDGRRACEWLAKMKAAGILLNSFSYNLAARPFVARGEYRAGLLRRLRFPRAGYEVQQGVLAGKIIDYAIIFYITGCCLVPRDAKCGAKTVE